jgi:putative peptidoglycan lipid II flippase
MTAAEKPARPNPRRPLAGSTLVAIGILVSRIFGIVREMLRAKYLGATKDIVGDVWSLAIRIPNVLQNLLGEGVLSASFFPVYARLLADGDEEEAGNLAGAILAILMVAMAAFVAIGVLAAPQIVTLLADKWTGEKYDLAVTLVRILFPGAALFVLAAWCIGVLNSHRRFLLPYLAPVFWNLAMIFAFVWFGRKGMPRQELVGAGAWASGAGAGLQFLVQMPSILKLVKRLRIRLDHRRASVRRVLSNFGPVVVSRGVVQVSGLIDLWIANQLPNGSAALLLTAQTVNMLPVSLFGMAVSASELPELSSLGGSSDERAALIRGRIAAASRRIAFFVIPSAVAFVALGDVIIRVLYERGIWSGTDTMYTWAILAGSAFGLLASTIGRLYSSAFYAMHDSKRPLRYATVRVALTILLGYLAAIPLTNALGIDRIWGTAGLTFTAGIAGWVEFLLLRRELERRVGKVGIPASQLGRFWILALAAAVVGVGIQLLIAPWLGTVALRYRSAIEALLVLGGFGLTYLGIASVLKIPEAHALTARILRR